MRGSGKGFAGSRLSGCGVLASNWSPNMDAGQITRAFRRSPVGAREEVPAVALDHLARFRSGLHCCGTTYPQHRVPWVPFQYDPIIFESIPLSGAVERDRCDGSVQPWKSLKSPLGAFSIRPSISRDTAHYSRRFAREWEPGRPVERPNDGRSTSIAICNTAQFGILSRRQSLYSATFFLGGGGPSPLGA